MGHMWIECPTFERKPKFEKILMTTWENSNSTSNSRLDKEQANLCLMANVDDEVTYIH